MCNSIEFLNGCKREAEMGHSLSLGGDVDGELLCFAMTSSLLSARRGLEYEDGSANWSPDADSVDDNWMTTCPTANTDLNLKTRQTRWEAQERSEEGVKMGGWANL